MVAGQPVAGELQAVAERPADQEVLARDQAAEAKTGRRRQERSKKRFGGAISS